MKKIFLLMLLFLMVGVNYGQLPDSLKQYYRLVNKAELAIVDSNYRQAMGLYTDAFRYKAMPFWRDMYNQSICAVLEKKYDIAYTNFEYLTDYGVNIDSLISRKELEVFFSSKYGKKLKKHCRKNIKRYNVELRHLYDSLLTADQFFRKKPGSYEVYGDTINKIDESNVLLLNRLIEKYGFPSQELIGIYFNGDHPFSIICIHNQVGARGKRYDYTQILYDALYSGKLDAWEALQLITGSTGNDYYGFAFTGLARFEMEAKKDNQQELTEWGFFKLTPEKEQDFDRRRAEIGLPKLADSRTKIIYNLKDKRFKLTRGAGKKVYLCATEEDYQRFTKNVIYLKQ